MTVKNENPAETIIAQACPQQHADGTAYQGIGINAVTAIARQYDLPARQIECCALENGVLPIRYARNQQSLNFQDQIHLLQACVSVVGLGGLGGTVCEILARAGVGRLRLFDADRFAEHNLNRQLFAEERLLGVAKAQAAKARLAAINSSVEVDAQVCAVEAATATLLLAQSDVVVDCLDNLTSRFIVENAARTLGIPFVSAAIAGAAGHITTIFPEDDGLALIFGSPATAPSKGAEVRLGCLPQGVVLMAALESSEVIKILTGRGTLLRNQLLVIDLMDNTIEKVRLGPA